LNFPLVHVRSRRPAKFSKSKPATPAGCGTALSELLRWTRAQILTFPRGVLHVLVSRQAIYEVPHAADVEILRLGSAAERPGAAIVETGPDNALSAGAREHGRR